MSIIIKKYTIINNAPKPIKWEDYEKWVINEYQKLLNLNINEKIYQNFFEENPCYIPGAYEIFGESGHAPYMDCLISQPFLNCGIKRKPDFMWLAKDSLSFCPVIIEIEKPSKKQFRKDMINCSDFTQSMNQIIEWKTILNDSRGRQEFYDFYNIPDWLRNRKFSPQYVLIYGRREEFDNNELLRKKRAEMRTNDIEIMSFNRLSPNKKCDDYVTATVSRGQYFVKHILPTHTYSPLNAESLSMLKEFVVKIENIPLISNERKDFMKQRYNYWIDFGNKEDKGIITIGDRE